MNSQKPVRFDSIDSFRGLAALAVVFSHASSGLVTAGFPSADVVNERAGDLLAYLFRGSSVYFMIITGFILGAKLPVWKNHPNGLLARAAQRITKIVIIYWIAIVLIMVINYVKYLLTGTSWYTTDILSIFAQFMFISNYMNDPHHYLAAGWYLEADFVIFIMLIACYSLWNKLPNRLQQQWRPVIFLSSIAAVFCCVLTESQGPYDHGLNAPIRLLTYFILGFLAWHARNYVSAMLALLLNSVLILILNDQTILHKHLFSSNAVVLAFIFYASHYSKTLAVLTSQPLIVKLYKINFGMFLFNLFTTMIGLSFARHVAPHSVPGLILILCFSFVGLFIGSYYFTVSVQRPVLKWHDAVWNRLLTRPVPSKYHNSEIMPGEISLVHSQKSAEMVAVQPSGK